MEASPETKQIHRSDIDLLILPDAIRTADEPPGTDTGLSQNIFQVGTLFFFTNSTLNISVRVKKRNSTGGFNKHQGLLREIGGCRVSALYIPAAYSKRTKIENFLANFIINFKQIKVWKQTSNHCLFAMMIVPDFFFAKSISRSLFMKIC